MNSHKRLFLKSIKLQNFATFTKQKIEFNKNFNAIIGETGSGKSLILDALQLIFGQRADKKIIRKNSNFAVIEAIFYCSDKEVSKFFQKIGHPFENSEIVIKRIIFKTEPAKSYLNFQACSLNTLSSFSKRFVDLVGQFENQKLLTEAYQLILLDSYANIADIINNYRQFFDKIQSLKQKLSSLETEQLEKKQREDFISFRIKEIEDLSPTLEDEKDLIKKKEYILNSNANKEVIQNILNILTDTESQNVLTRIKSVIGQIDNGSNLTSQENINKLHEAHQLIEEVSFDLSSKINLDEDEYDINHIIDRLDCYQTLKRKLGGTTESMLNQYKLFTEELNSLGNLDENILKIKNEIKTLTDNATELANKIHQIRVEKSQYLSQQLTNSVQELRMNGAILKMEVSKLEELTPTGISKLDFYGETNPGEGFFKIKDCASGGELSRILLGLRQIISATDRAGDLNSISIFLFDEIDAGIGGETALYIGKALKDVSANSQVIAITHLPQIASFADKLILVSKHSHTIDNGEKRTVSSIQEIDQKNEQQKFVEGMTICISPDQNLKLSGNEFALES